MASTDEEIVWHTEILPWGAKKAFDFLSCADWLKRSKWYLAGGTAMALQVAHRRSLDFDFFTTMGSFSVSSVLNHMPSNVWKTNIARESTIYGLLSGTKISFITYPFFTPKQPYHWCGKMRVLSLRDIAVMKIIAISQRGRKRDFIDLYWYIKNVEPLTVVVNRLPEQYRTVAHNYHHIIKSLMYFTDADSDPMPKIFFDADWKTIKSFFSREVPKVAKELLGLK